MPYKERLRTHGKLSQKKSSYQVTNWPAYNQALKNRGDLTIWIGEDIKDKSSTTCTLSISPQCDKLNVQVVE